MEQNSTTNVAKEEYVQYIVIRLGAELFGIDIKYVENIVRMQRLTRVPKVPAYIKGVINLRGEVVPVVSLRLKMELEDDVIDKATRIIILKLENEGNTGVMVDNVREVVTLSSDMIEKISFDTKEGKVSNITGVGKYQNELISILNMNCVSLEEAEATTALA